MTSSVLIFQNQPENDRTMSYNPDIAVKTIAIVKKLLHEGKLTPARIDESDAHIVQFKERLGKFQ